VLRAEGLVRINPGALPTAPESFDLEGTRILIHDSSVDGLAQYDKGKRTGTEAKGKLNSGARDVSLSGNSLYVLDGGGRLASFTKSSAKKAFSHKATSAPLSLAKAHGRADNADSQNAPPEMPAHISVDTKGTLRASYWDDESLPVSSDLTVHANPASTTAATRLSIDDKAFYVLDPSGRRLLTIPADGEPSRITEIARDAKYVYYEVVEGYHSDSLGDLYSRYVYKYSAAGDIVATYALMPMNDYVPSTYLKVKGGHVYQLATSGTAAVVIKLKPQARPTKMLPAKSAYRTGATPAALGEAAPASAVALAAWALPRRVAYTDLITAVRLANLTWTYNPTTNGNITQIASTLRSKVVQPHQLRGLTGKKTMTGYPYAWGGYDSETTSSQPAVWSNFASGISKGKYAGNISSANGSYVSGTVGIDCSGLVSVAYKLGVKYGTSSLLDGRFFTASTAKPVGGDIYDKPGSHVIIVQDRRLETGKWMIVASESTTTSKVDKVVHWTQPQDSYTGYTTGKYRNMDYQCTLLKC